MGHRTLSLQLVWRALFLDPSAYDELRDDDNPFIEAALLVVLVGFVTALLSMVGELLSWASGPSMDAIRDVILRTYQNMPWWQQYITPNPQVLAEFNRWWDAGWSIIPALFGASSPTRAALNLVLWPLAGLLGWLIYGLLAYAFARLLGGRGSLNETLGATALAATPLMLHGLGLIPFLVLGSVVSTWQLLCRYRGLRSAQRLSVGRAAWATVLPFLAYLVLGLMLAVMAWLVLMPIVRR